MIQIFFKHKGQIVTASTTDLLDELGFDDVVWMDLFSPTGEEKRAVEAFLNTTLQSRAQAEEIESSSRYSETETTIFANTNFLMPGPDSYSMEAVSFILCEGIIVTIRHVQLRSFSDIQRKIQINYKLYPTGYHIFVGILENRIDLDADMIELMAKEIARYSKKVSASPDLLQNKIIFIFGPNISYVRIAIITSLNNATKLLKKRYLI